MNRNKDQVLLENLYSDIRKNIHSASTDDMGRDIETQEPEAPQTENGSDYERAEEMLEKSLNEHGIPFHDIDEADFRQSIEQILATMHHSPEDVNECIEKCTLSLRQCDSCESDSYDGSVDEERPLSFESKTILDAYIKIISEAKKKKPKGKLNPYAVGKEDDGKNAKKSEKPTTSEKIK